MKTQITYLKAGQPHPEGEPRRYRDNRGYTRLRWQVAKGEIIEAWERDESGAMVLDRPKIDTTLDVFEVVNLYQSGMSTREVAAEMNCDPVAVSRVLRRANVPARPSRSRDYVPPPTDAVVRMYVDEKLRLTEVARLTGSTATTITKILRAAGYETGRPGVQVEKKVIGESYDQEFKRMRRVIEKRSGGQCEGRVLEVCTGRASPVHHRKLRGQGGLNDEETLIHLCFHCHVWAHANPKKARERRLIVPSWADPASPEWKWLGQ